jgi:site-specific DNA recombinase
VQAQLQHNGRTGGIEVRNRYGALLKRLLFCKSCGHTMVHTFNGSGKKRYRYYTCTHAIKSGYNSCPTRSLPAAEVEQFVIDQIRSIAKDAELRAEVLRQTQTHVENELSERRSQRRQLSRELASHHTEIQRLATKEPATSATTARIAELHERVAQIETGLSRLGHELEQIERGQLTENDVASAFADFDNVWKALSPREQSQVLALLIARVEFDAEDSTVAVTFHRTAIRTLVKGRPVEAA